MTRIAIQHVQGLTGLLEQDIPDLNADNVLPPAPLSPALTKTELFVRTTGSDATGDGSIGNPYRTISFALAQIPVFIPDGQVYVVDATGVIQDTGTAGYKFPQFISHSESYFDLDPDYVAFFFVAPVTLQGIPELWQAVSAPLANIAGGEVSSITADANTGLATLHTTKTYTAHVLKGAFLADSAGNIAPVIDNTAGPNSTISIVAPTTGLTAPFQLVQPTCGFANADGVTSVTIDCSAVIGLNGVTDSSSAGNSVPDTIIAGGANVVIIGSQFGFMEFAGSGVAPNQNGGVIFGAIFGTGDPSASSFEINGACPPVLSNVLFNACLEVQASSAATGVWSMTEFASSGSGIMGTVGGDMWSADIDWANGLIDSSAGEILAAVAVQGPGSAFFAGVTVQNCVEGGGLLLSTKATLSSVKGTGNLGIGLVQSSGKATVDVNTTVTGAGGDFKVGNMGVRTWADFRANFPVKIQYDDAGFQQYKQSGTAAIAAAGVSPAINARITANSRIQVTRKTAAGSPLGVDLEAKASDRVNGNPGNFKVTAIDTAGAAVGTDTSSFDWQVAEDGPANQFGTEALVIQLT